MKQDASNKF